MMSGYEEVKTDNSSETGRVELQEAPRSPCLLPPTCNNGELKCTQDNAPAVPARARRRRRIRRNINWEAISVTQYLENNKEMLEEYVLDNIPVEEVEQWLFKKTRNLKNNEQCNVKKMTNCTEKFMDLIGKLQKVSDEHSMLNEIAGFVSCAMQADAYRVFKLYPDQMNFVQYFTQNATGNHNQESSNLVRASPDEEKLILAVARRGAIWRMSKNFDVDLFPDPPQELLQNFGIDETRGLNHVLYQPILNATGNTEYIIEMWRTNNHFDKRDEDMSTNFVIWNSIILFYCNLHQGRERNMTEILLEEVKAIFENLVSVDQLIKRMLKCAQRLVNADRASLFLVDNRSSELVSTVFDLQFKTGQERDVEKKQIRIPINRGIAGHVARTGETLNIPDAYSDDRFNREVDEVTGYTTSSILCMPVKVKDKVIAVVQMVNKKDNNEFHHEDKVAFEMFSTVFGLALHHAKLYDNIMLSEQKYAIVLEIISYHNTCKENDVQEILEGDLKINVNLDDFYLDPYKFDDFEKCKAVLLMFDDLFGLSNFDKMTVTRFVLTVRKNYRRVPYHNFNHGWSVAHAMYVMLKNDNCKRFGYKRRLALFVACLCHDLDHRGYTNEYLNETASPLAAMYTTSPLEHHHFNITMKILQQEGHHIFSHLSIDDYTYIIQDIQNCILATDLAQFFSNLKKVEKIFNSKDTTEPRFDWAATEHSNLAMAISMTAADLSASTKPWDIQIKTVDVIFKEFYDQGDKERDAGKTKIDDMMDRNKPEQQAPTQVGFLSQICLPCYEILHRIMPSTKPMYKMVLKNLSIWKSRANKCKSEESIQNNDTLKSVSDSKLDDVIEGKLPDNSAAEKYSNADAVNKATVHDDGEIKKTLQSMTSDSTSWDEEQYEKGSKASEIWKAAPTEDFLTDDVEVVIASQFSTLSKYGTE